MAIGEEKNVAPSSSQSQKRKNSVYARAHIYMSNDVNEPPVAVDCYL